MRALASLYGRSVDDKSVYRKLAASEHTYYPKQVTAGRVIYEPRFAIQIGVTKAADLPNRSAPQICRVCYEVFSASPRGMLLLLR